MYESIYGENGIVSSNVITNKCTLVFFSSLLFMYILRLFYD